VPVVASGPVQPPEAVQDVALLLDQDSLELPPAPIAAGLAVKVTVGAAAAPLITRFTSAVSTSP
jgi:hypothetical protein